MNEMSTWRGLEDRRSQVEAVRENSTRPARAWATYKTTGVGVVFEEAVFRFRCSFLDLPIFTYGATFNAAGADLPTTGLPPVCTAGVYEWVQTPADQYAGAYCWFSVVADTAPANLKMIFTLAWEGIASKDFFSSTGFTIAALDI